jgi:hypothetical protein
MLPLGTEYLSWFFKNSPISAPLVTSGSLLANLPGALGEFGTQVLIGNESINTHRHSGGRFALGHWLDANQKFGVEGVYFFLSPTKRRQTISTSGQLGSPTLAVPLFDSSGFTSQRSPGESIYVLPGPFMTSAGFAGKFILALTNRLQGAETNALFNFYDTCYLGITALAGFRWAQLHEGLSFDVKTMGAAGAPTSGQFFNSFDRFKTQNNFYGVQLGIRAKYEYTKFFGQILARVAFGDMHENINIQGHSMTSNGTLFFPVEGFAGRLIKGGIFAQPSNIGQHSKDVLAAIPEIDLKLGYHVMNHVDILVDYGFMYISHVARPGKQINRHINTTRTALADASRALGSAIAPIGPPGPSFKFYNASFWAQGFGVGLEFNF